MTYFESFVSRKQRIWLEVLVEQKRREEKRRQIEDFQQSLLAIQNDRARQQQELNDMKAKQAFVERTNISHHSQFFCFYSKVDWRTKIKTRKTFYLYLSCISLD